MTNLTKTTNIFAALVLLASASAWAVSSVWSPLLNIDVGDTLVIDDFENDDEGENVDIVSNLGAWYSFTGEEYTVTFKSSIVDSDGEKSKVLRIDYEFKNQTEQLNNGWEWIETRVYVAPNYTSLDFSSCTEIQFDYKAIFNNKSDGENWLDLRFRLEGDEKKANAGSNYYSVYLDESNDWQTVTFHWNDFEQGYPEYYPDGIDIPVETVQKNMFAFSWFWHTENAATGTLELDNFRCINQPTYEVKFMAGDEVFESGIYYRGTTPSNPTADCEYNENCRKPTKEPSETMMYTFKEWNKDIKAVTKPTVYKALFDSTELPKGKPLNMAVDTLWLENFEDGDKVGSLGGSWDFFNSLKSNTSSFESDGSEWSGNLAVILEGSFKEGEDDVYLNFRLTDVPEKTVSFEYCFDFFGDEGVAIPEGWGDRQFADPTDIDLSDELPLCKNNETWNAEFEPNDKYGYPPEESIRIKFNADGKAEGTEYMLLKVINLSKGLAVAQDMGEGYVPFKIYDVDKMDVQEPTSSIVTVSGNKILGIGNLTEPEDSYEWLGARLYLQKDSSAVDMGQCEAIQYRYKGGPHQFRVESAYETGWQHYYMDFPASDDWKTAAIYWNRLSGYEWADEGDLPLKQVGVIKRKVVALTWQRDNFSTDAEGKGPIEIDDIRCIRNLPNVLAEFYSEGNKVAESSVPYSAYFRDVKIPKDPVKVSEDGQNYVFVGWTPEKYYDFEMIENLRLDARFVPTRKLEVSSSTLLIDDFESGDLVSPLGGSWSISTKNKSATVNMAVAKNKNADSTWLKASFTNENGGFTRADIALNLLKDDVALDLSQCEAIQYDYRGMTLHQFHLGTEFDNLEIERDYFETVGVYAEEDGVNWRTKTVYLENAQLECHNACRPVSEVRKAVYQLSWSFETDIYDLYDSPRTFEIDNIKCVRTNFGAVNIALDSSKAIIDGYFTDAEGFEIPKDLDVKEVEFRRTFEVGKSATIMLPFSIDVSKVEGAKFYGFAQMDYVDGEWKAGVTEETEKLLANTPYMVIPTGNAVTFNLKEDEYVTLTTSGAKTTVLGDWELRGASGNISLSDSTHLIGRVYGFAGQAKDGFKVGDFVKFGKGATIPALRCYLVYTGELPDENSNTNNAPLPRGVASIEGLQDSISIEILEESGNVMAVGTFDSKRNEFRVNRYHLDQWYDLRGRRLKGKPTVKGTYYNNGNMVIIK